MLSEVFMTVINDHDSFALQNSLNKYALLIYFTNYSKPYPETEAHSDLFVDRETETVCQHIQNQYSEMSEYAKYKYSKNIIDNMHLEEYETYTLCTSVIEVLQEAQSISFYKSVLAKHLLKHFDMNDRLASLPLSRIEKIFRSIICVKPMNLIAILFL